MWRLTGLRPTNAIVSFIWGAGGQVAVQQNGKWVGQLTSPQSEADIRFYADLYRTGKVSPSKYVGQTELGNPGATSGGSNEDFALGKLDMYIDGPWAQAEFPSSKFHAQWASFPIPSQNGPAAAPAFAGGSDLGVWANSPDPKADWALIQVMDSPANATSFANSQGFFPPFTSQLTGGHYAGNPIMVALTFLGLDQQKYTLPIYVNYFFGRGGAAWGSIMAASITYTIPPVLFFVLVQRRMRGGLIAGAVKG